MSDVPKQQMKLFNLPRGALFNIMDKSVQFDEPLKFIRLDGMYSVCEYKGETLHIYAGSIVELVH
ncbi:hypothetical protein UFOVP26_11 [uncultured Caudovirales phage]|uniref:Uncharacterized protein n=1 Tax=uncultured Caudovirales phage TaxID=2100421 RepID=A0A6J5KNB6_9CAUD|nr:hypothetical protein UFOVP26_11 [uncultured Caudovirales phage]CAB4123912.1 hypothetical protein UFOVP44_86 [uncultured Caudovirales phage]CAB5219405.1 hypothetical protein UFOVP220_77 [uncultured Caudovirales phage]